MNPVAVKTVAFAVSAACAGLAGGLFAPLSGFVTPSTFTFSQSILFVLVVIIGGAGTVTGPLAGAAVVVLLPELLAGLAEYRLLFFGALLLVVLLIAPEGIVGEAARWLLGRRRAVGPAPAAGSDAAPRPRAQVALAVEGLAIAFGGVRAVAGFDFRARAPGDHQPHRPEWRRQDDRAQHARRLLPARRRRHPARPDAIQGRPAHAIARAGVARTYQTSQLFGTMSVLDNLDHRRAARTARMVVRTRAGRGHRARPLARGYVGYRGDLARRAADLPHVDRRLVEIARALATGPSVLLLDEPAAGLSRTDKDALAALLRRVADAGIAVVLVEHDMSLVMGISDRVVVIDAGVAHRRRAAARGAGGSGGEEGLSRRGGGAVLRRGVPATMAPGATLLEVGKLVAGYGAEPVLRGIDLGVREGEMVTVLGANGAGKSTLMRALAGLHRPVEGGISLRGGGAASSCPRTRSSPAAWRSCPRAGRCSPSSRCSTTSASAPSCGATRSTRRSRRCSSGFRGCASGCRSRAGLLSGGEQQMLALARGLMAKPRLLLLDEPSLGLAPAVIKDLFAALDRLRGEEATILLVDQMAGLALTLADRALCHRGRADRRGGECRGDRRRGDARAGVLGRRGRRD